MQSTRKRVTLIDWMTPTLLRRSTCHQSELYRKVRQGTRYPSLTGTDRSDLCRSRSSSHRLSLQRVVLYLPKKAGSLRRSTSPKRRRRMMMSNRTTRTHLRRAPTRSSRLTWRPCTGGSLPTRRHDTIAYPRRCATIRRSAASRARRFGRG